MNRADSEEKLIVHEADRTIPPVKCSFSPFSEANETINFVCLTNNCVCLIISLEHGISIRDSKASLIDNFVYLIISLEHGISTRDSKASLTDNCVCLIIPTEHGISTRESEFCIFTVVFTLLFLRDNESSAARRLQLKLRILGERF